MKEENNKKKKVFKIILIILGVLLGVFILISVLPFVMFAVGMLWNMFFKYPAKPIEEHGEFPFEIVYEYNGEEKTIKDTIICDFNGYSYAMETGNYRDWKYSFKENKEYGVYKIDKENEKELSIDVPSACDYYMGSKDESKEDAKPHIYYVDKSTGTNYYETDAIDTINIKIIKWSPSDPLQNNFK